MFSRMVLGPSVRGRPRYYRPPVPNLHLLNVTISKAEVWAQYGISKASIYNVLKSLYLFMTRVHRLVQCLTPSLTLC